MAVLLVSTNPLFREVLAETLGQAHVELVRADPGHLVASVKRVRPSVILLGGPAEPTLLSALLQCASWLSCCRVIVVDPSCNDLLVVDVRAGCMSHSADLLKAVEDGLARANQADGIPSE